MGNCLGSDVKAAKYEIGQANSGELQTEQEVEAENLASGTMAYCTWLNLSIECKRLLDADIMRCVCRSAHYGRTLQPANAPDPASLAFLQPFTASRTPWSWSLRSASAAGRKSGAQRSWPTASVRSAASQARRPAGTQPCFSQHILPAPAAITFSEEGWHARTTAAELHCPRRARHLPRLARRWQDSPKHSPQLSSVTAMNSDEAGSSRASP
jgi:hypothetical protein